MSSRTLDVDWFDAQKELENVFEKEALQSAKPAKEVEKTFQFLAQCYARYILIMRKLNECYECMVHPQKRTVLKKLLEGTMGRIVELKHEMVGIKLCEGINLNDVLAEMSLTPDDIIIPVPKYFRQERWEETAKRLQAIDEIQARFGLMEEKTKPFVSTTEEAVLVIQRMERARQGRLRAEIMRESYLKKSYEKQMQLPSGKNIVSYCDPHSSATKIQRVWKGYSTWQKIQKQRQEEMLFLGMIFSPSTEKKYELNESDDYEERLSKLQLTCEQDCQSAFNQFKDDIYRSHGEFFKESLESEVRNWFFAYKDRAGKFPDYPSDEEGGYKSSLLTDVDQMIQNEQEEEKIRLHKEKKAGRAKDKKVLKPEKKLSISNKKSPKPQIRSTSAKPAVNEEEYAKKKKSNCLPTLLSACDTYKNVWENKIVTSFQTFGGRAEVFDENLIRQTAKLEVETELKKQVNMLMRQELYMLKLAFYKDKGKKGKKLKAAMKSTTKKAKTVKRKKKEKDVVPGRTIESLFEELVRERIIKKFPLVRLKDFIGEDNLGHKYDEDICPVLTSADIRRVLTEYCILPMGCHHVHSKCSLIKSLMLVGPPKSGKTMLVQAICNELDATLIDLSASNLIGKYSSREDLRVLFNIVSKVGRAMQPSVILVEDADQMFIKNLSKVDKSDPKRLKKGLQKLIKGISGDDLMIVIGTARRPFECDMKALGATYNKIIMLQKPDHSTRNTLWKTKIRSLGGSELSSVDFGNLVKVSDGYSSGAIVNCVAQVLTSYRVALQKKKPLQLEEFVWALSKVEPVYKEEEAAFKLWVQKTPLSKKRAAALEPEESRKAREKLLSKKRKQMELEKRFYGGEGSGGKKKRKSKKRK
ncbi:hypothetical protein CHUAL_004941 [Chamberlinius hualienensis]